ncbi:histone deacetylase family protein [Desulfobulbus oralis]|uniref:Histone deacetylase n=1 Tax=Desulfobulbus oralis TaxID=1986146 RepID=A0A2L1GPR0_9BACT|nr:histone deacetylase [Desulfobulbus oralis]AVD71626.1 histone deacetylase [Desulfobulbus oralis]
MMQAAHTLGIVFFPAYDWAISPTHPEREERLLYTQDQFREEGLFDIAGISEHRPLRATDQDILRTHFCFPNLAAVCSESHRISAGGAMRAAQLVLERQSERAFALVRPPGHHAMKVVHANRGFCNINNEAVMLAWLRRHYGLKRIAIVDTDCHHGDGTQDIFWHDPDTLFISLHQDGRTLYPGSGFPHEDGGPKARGRTINIPLPPLTGDTGYLQVIEQAVLPILEDFKPELLINSAGQDNHYSDPITNMNFSAQGYARLTALLKPDIAVLEGGYAIKSALPYVNLGIALAMAGCDYSAVREPDYLPGRYEESRNLMLAIDYLCELAKKTYFSPEPQDCIREQGFFIRERRIYYDTDDVSEVQREELRDCSNCPGCRIIRSASSRSGPCLGVEIPENACHRCESEALALFQRKNDGFGSAQLMDHKNQVYTYRQQ